MHIKVKVPGTVKFLKYQKQDNREKYTFFTKRVDFLSKYGKKLLPGKTGDVKIGRI
jgi:hypothetical protein